MKRVIIYGDIHGCLDELKQLREKIDIKKNDIEISVGDILNKGPYLAHEMIRYMQEHHIDVVMGNNEVKALKQYRKYRKSGASYLKTLRPFEIATVLSMQDEDAAFLQELPYFLRLENLTVLHGGLTPKMKLEKLDDIGKKELTLVRYLNKKLEPIPWSDSENRYKFWSEVYDGREGFIVAGHHPFPEPKIDKYAMDIDTGCVYGGKLTAAVFEMKKERIDTAKPKLFSQKAARDYWNEYLHGVEDEAD
jgi:bis(5'-nucleosyl)-tetraphosphatase (symmetrical)